MRTDQLRVKTDTTSLDLVPNHCTSHSFPFQFPVIPPNSFWASVLHPRARCEKLMYFFSKHMPIYTSSGAVNVPSPLICFYDHSNSRRLSASLLLFCPRPSLCRHKELPFGACFRGLLVAEEPSQGLPES